MVANVSVLFNCPKCLSDMSCPEKPERCPKCGYRFRKPGEVLTQKFEWGKDLNQQLFELVQQDMEKFKDKSIAELLPSITKEQEEEMRVSNQARFQVIQQKRQSELIQFLLNSHPEDVGGHLNVILQLMSCVLSSSNMELVMKMANWGKEVEKISKVLNQFIECGGKVYEKHPTNTGGDKPGSTQNT